MFSSVLAAGLPDYLKDVIAVFPKDSHWKEDFKWVN